MNEYLYRECTICKKGKFYEGACPYCEIERLIKKIELYDKALIRKAQLEDDVVLLKQENTELRERLKELLTTPIDE